MLRPTRFLRSEDGSQTSALTAAILKSNYTSSSSQLREQDTAVAISFWPHPRCPRPGTHACWKTLVTTSCSRALLQAAFEVYEASIAVGEMMLEKWQRAW